jgi:hypothetical protein
MSPTLLALTGTGVLLASWYALILGVALATRPRDLPAGPATMELGAEPPAIVNLLVTRCGLSPDAADATLLDLAARRILELHQPGRDPADLLVRVRVPEPEGLTSYERRVFDRVTAVAGARFVPLEDVLRGYAEGGPNWFKLFRSEVVRDAEARGLVRARRLGPPVVLVCVLTGMALGCFGILPFQPSDQSDGAGAIGYATAAGWFCVSPVIGFVLLLVAARHLSGARYTDAGRRAGTYWLGVAGWLAAHEDLADLPPAAVAVWDRYLAYGVALGVNPLAAGALNLRAGRRVRFASRFTGTVRTVEVRYPWWPFAYTQAGVRALWCTGVLLGWAAFWVFAAPVLDSWPVYAVAGLLTARTGYRLIRSLVAKLSPVTVTGQVLAAHLWRPRVTVNAGWIQLVVDDGTRDRIRPWLSRADRAGGVRAGDTVRIRAQPWTRYVLALDVPHRAAPKLRPAPRP